MIADLPRELRTLRGATLADGRAADVVIAGGLVEAILPAGSGAAIDGAWLDLEGFLLLTAPADPHSHLDKALSYDLIRPPQGDLDLAIESWKAFVTTETSEGIENRARDAALRMLANGTTALRCHVDILQSGDPMRGVDALNRVRDELRGLMDIELVALAGPKVPDADIESALDRGVDLVGGAPHLADDPIADTRRLLAIAERRGVGVDLHTDESLHGAVTLGEYARIVRDWSVVTSAGHCVRLGTMERAELDGLIEEVRLSGIGIIANPITNLYLQGWEQSVSMPRGITAMRELIDAGVSVAAGADNVRDPFNPVGRCDALETASLLVTAAHLTLEESLAAVTDGARAVMGLPAAGAAVGASAEFLAIRAANIGEAIAFASPDRHVIHEGRLVSSTMTVTRTAPARKVIAV